MRLQADHQTAMTVWLTGLPCSGKSTLARELEKQLVATGMKVQVLDGDEIREGLNRGLGFSREDRQENIRRIAFLAQLLTRNGVLTIVAAVSPYREGRAAARRMLGPFFEVHVTCPVEVCIERDTKGLYKRAMAGEIRLFTGVSDEYEAPKTPDVVAETDRETVDQSIVKILSAMRTAGYLPAPMDASIDLVFVLSIGRSGSTFLLRTLQQIESLVCYKEEWNVATLYAGLLDDDGRVQSDVLVKQYAKDSKALPHVAALLPERVTKGRISLAEFLGAIRDILSDSPRTFVIKTTDLEQLWLYKRLFPGARFIVNIRHPIHYLHSWNLIWVAQNYHVFPTHWTRPIHAEGALRVQRAFFQAAVHRNDKDVIVVRLEDMPMEDPDATAPLLKQIAEFCGASLSTEAAKSVVAKRVGINHRFDYIDKDKEYADFGLTTLERMSLEQAVPFVLPFYPDFAAELQRSRQVSPIPRLFRYAQKKVAGYPLEQRPVAWLKWCYKAGTLLRSLVR